MNALVTILSVLFMLFGIGLFFSSARGSLIAAVICIGAGAYAYDEKSLLPLGVGFGLLWVLRLIGVEER
jgi:hypothetical protein